MTNQEFTEQRERLGNRSSKIIGGYVTENLFIEKFLQRKNIQYSKGWWYSKEANKVYFFIVKNELSEFDKRIITRLQTGGQVCYQLICTGDGWRVCSLADGIMCSLQEFVVNNSLVAKNSLTVRAENGINEDEVRQYKRCIAYYNRLNILHDIENSIQIEDAFLNKYFITSNIDLIIEGSSGSPICLEIKFKNEFKSKGHLVLGMDIFQYDNIFRLLETKGIPVFNIVLYNDIKEGAIERKTTTSIFDFIEQKEMLKEAFIWKYSRVGVNVEYEKHNTQAYTSWREMNTRDVYCIPLSQYGDLVDVEQVIIANSPCSTGLNYGYCPICRKNNKYFMRRIVSYNNDEFMGCPNYKNHSTEKGVGDI